MSNRLMGVLEAANHIAAAALTNGLERHDEFHRMEDLASKLYEEHFAGKEPRINFATFIAALILNYSRNFAIDEPIVEQSKPAEA